MHVLVTGGTGLIGSAVCARLLDSGAQPVAFDVAPQPGQLGPLARELPIERGDILDLPALLRAIRQHRIQRVIHTAAMLTAAVAVNPWQGIRVNYLGTVSLLEACRLEGLERLVFCSSNTVYDASAVQGRPIREGDPLVPRSVYATTKLACEHTGINYAERYGVGFVACRFALLYGPGRSQSGGAQLWLDPMLRSLVRTGRARINHAADDASEYVYNRDAAQALVRAALAERVPHHVYNVGDGSLTPFSELVAAARACVPGSEVELTGERDTSFYAPWRHPMDQSLAAQDLGYRAEYPVPVALAHYVERLRSEDADAAL